MLRQQDRSQTLHASVIDVSALTQSVRDEMYALFARHYAATNRQRFESDLAAKDRVVMLRDSVRQLRGFSTLAVSALNISDTSLRVVFSGDTIIDPRSWGSQAFAFAWIRLIGRIAAEAPDLPLYWLLIVKGHRTYRYLPTFGLRFVPDWRTPDDPRLVALRNAIAEHYFGADYDARRGIVTYRSSRGHLGPALAHPTARECARDDVRFFLERNPGYVKGDELVCLCALTLGNMRPLTRRLFLQGFGE